MRTSSFDQITKQQKIYKVKMLIFHKKVFYEAYLKISLFINSKRTIFLLTFMKYSCK